MARWPVSQHLTARRGASRQEQERLDLDQQRARALEVRTRRTRIAVAQEERRLGEFGKTGSGHLKSPILLVGPKRFLPRASPGSHGAFAFEIENGIDQMFDCFWGRDLAVGDTADEQQRRRARRFA